MGQQVNRPRLNRRQARVMETLERHDVNDQQLRAWSISKAEVRALLKTQLLVQRPGGNGPIYKPVYSWRDYAPL